MPGMTDTGAALPSPDLAPRPIEGVFDAVGIAGASGAEGALGAIGALGAAGAAGAEGVAGGALRAGAGGAGAGFGLGGTSWRYCGSKFEKSIQKLDSTTTERRLTFDGAHPSCAPFLINHHPESNEEHDQYFIS